MKNRAPIFVAVGLIGLILGIGIFGARNGSSADSSDTEVVSGSFGPLTVDAEPTTTVGVPPTVSDAEPVLPPVTRTLKQGLVGDDVKMLQERLVDLGFDPGPVDGGRPGRSDSSGDAGGVVPPRAQGNNQW